MTLSRLAVSGLLILVACAPATGVDPTAADTSSTTTTTELPVVSTTTATSGPSTSTTPLVAGCPDAGEFIEGGQVTEITQAQSDSRIIGLIRWDETQSCETFRFSFVTSEGAPATTPPGVRVIYLDELPVIRIYADVSATVITDQLVETAMVSRLFVARGLDGQMFVDLHLSAPVQAHAEIASSPAELVLDLQPGIVDYEGDPVFSDHTVVLLPGEGTSTESPVLIEGYARTFESTVLIIATAGDQVVAEELTTAADSVATWGQFRAQVELPPGETALFIGDEDQEDGGLEGVTIGITVR